MPSKYAYQQQISNPYLGKVVIIKGMTKAEVQFKVNQQLSAWREQETKKREQYRLLDLKTQAENQSRDAQARQATLQELLRRGLRNGRRFNWNTLKNSRPFASFQFMEPRPTYEHISQTLGVPTPKPALEKVFSGMKKKREDKEIEARNVQYLL